MRVVQIATGPLKANAFVVYKDGAEQAFVIDPGADFERIIERLETHGIKTVTHILLTHGHFDHIGAVAQLKDYTGAKVCIHCRDASMLESQQANLSFFSGTSVRLTKADVLLKGGETINAAGIDVQVLHTPGHSGGSVCYIAGDALFSGDTLFYMYCGRTDFPGSDAREYRHSLLHVLRGLDRDYTVYTGHGIKTTLYAEFSANPFFKQ